MPLFLQIVFFAPRAGAFFRDFALCGKREPEKQKAALAFTFARRGAYHGSNRHKSGPGTQMPAPGARGEGRWNKNGPGCSR